MTTMTTMMILSCLFGVVDTWMGISFFRFVQSSMILLFLVIFLMFFLPLGLYLKYMSFHGILFQNSNVLFIYILHFH